jgi:hypothetical protein
MVLGGGRLGGVEVKVIEVARVVSGLEAVENRAALEGDFSGVFGNGGVGFEDSDGHGKVEGEAVAICPGAGDFVVGAGSKGVIEGRAVEGEGGIRTPAGEAKMQGEGCRSPRGQGNVPLPGVGGADFEG